MVDPGSPWREAGPDRPDGYTPHVVETLYAALLGAVMCSIAVASAVVVIRLFKGQDS